MGTMQMHVRCNKSLTVEQKPDGFCLAEECPAGHVAGLKVSTLLDQCCSCNRLADAVIVSPVKPAAAAAAAKVIPPMPIYNDTAICSPMIAIPAEDIPTTKPETAIAQAVAQVISIDKRDYPKEAQAAANELPSIESLMLPSGMTLGMPAGQLDVEKILSTIPGCTGGPSTGGLSAHIISDALCWRKMYLSKVLGLVSNKSKAFLDFGTLFHACLAMRYMYGETRQWEPCDAVAQAGGAEVARDVKRLLTVQFEKYALDEWKHWCPRGIEYNMLAFLPCKIERKTVGVPLSCRIDMVLALKGEHDPHPGPGPVPQGVYLCDHKTSSAITYDLVEGYGMDFQFLTQCAIFKLSHAEDVLGPLRGVMVFIAAKGRKEPTFDSFQRIEAPISHGAIDDFIEYELKPMATELYARLADPAMRANKAAWPKDRRVCHGRWGRCTYFDACDRGAVAEFHEDASRILNIESLAKPPTGWSMHDSEEVSVGKEKKVATPSTEAEASEEVKMIGQGLLAQMESDERFAKLRKENFLTPGHTYQSVSRGLAASLKQFYAAMAEQKTVFHMGSLEWKVQKTGFAWKNGEGKSGRVAWGAVSEWVCKNVWFNIAAAQPE